MVRVHRGRKIRPPRHFASRILVVTEGIRTEPQYVEGLNRYLRDEGAHAIVKPVSVGKDPLKVVQKCVERRHEAVRSGKDYDHYVCLVDVDEHHTLQAAQRLAEQQSILLLISNLKFEVWLRWHAEDKRSVLSSSQLDEITAELRLVKGKMLSPTFPFASVDVAYRVARSADPDMRAGRIGPDPSSAMPILVDLMRGA